MKFVIVAVDEDIDCHLKPFYPDEYFSCKIHEFDTIRFENRLPKKYFEVRRIDVNYRRPFSWDNEISNLLKIFTNVNWKDHEGWFESDEELTTPYFEEVDVGPWNTHGEVYFEQRIELLSI